MPTYDYQCRSCGATTEVIHSMLDDGPSICAACGGSLRRVLFPTGIIFKGSGFYRTDSRAAAGAADSGSGSTASPASNTSGSESPSGSTKDSTGTSSSAPPAKESSS